MNPALRFVLGFEGVTDADAAAIDAALPALIRLNARLEKLDPIIRKVWPDIVKIAPILQATLRKIGPDLQTAGPILLDGYPDLIAVLPIMQRLLQLAKGT